MAENKYKAADAKIKSVRREGAKNHRDRKNPHQADLFAAQRKERNAQRGHQALVEGEYMRFV